MHEFVRCTVEATDEFYIARICPVSELRGDSVVQQFYNTCPGAAPHEFAQDLDASDRNAFSEGHLLMHSRSSRAAKTIAAYILMDSVI